jgi:hypothetical protein
MYREIGSLKHVTRSAIESLVVAVVVMEGGGRVEEAPRLLGIGVSNYVS